MAKKKKKSVAEVQKELRDLSKGEAQAPSLELRKVLGRVALVALAVWVLALGIASVIHARWPVYGATGVTILGAGGLLWLLRYVKRQQALGALLKGAETKEAREEALKKLESEFKGGDTQALLARAQLEMQDDPGKALATLESINLDKVMAPVAAQVRAMRAQIHLARGETNEARQLVDKLDLGKQNEPKVRAMLATVAGEAWARSGAAKKAVETLELFNPDDPEWADLTAQMWRARAFAYAGNNDMKGIGRALRKLAEMNPHLLGMFVGQKKIHPLLEREAKQIAMKSGAVPRKMVRQKM
jgi:hypothetical protein